MMQKTGKREIMQMLSEEKRIVSVAFYSSYRNNPNVIFGSIEHRESQNKPGYYISDSHIPLRSLSLNKNGKLLELEVRR